MTRYRETLLTAFIFSLFSSAVVFIVQTHGSKIVRDCSYLDPIAIDILALLAAIFLLTEGLIDIHSHKDSPVRKQLCRCVRVAFASSIITIHILQALYKA